MCSRADHHIRNFCRRKVKSTYPAPPAAQRRRRELWQKPPKSDWLTLHLPPRTRSPRARLSLSLSLQLRSPTHSRLRGACTGEIEAKDGLPSADRNNKATLLLTGPF